MTFALAGNQNSGKTTLFNALTGGREHVGNFPGVTVEQKSGALRQVRDCTVVDLPGIYSLRSYTQEETVARDYILNSHPDGIINIVDATNPERNLYLTLQLLELRVPMVVALNMMDELRQSGGGVDTDKLSALLGVPVIPISAAKGEGIGELVAAAVSVAREKRLGSVRDFCAKDSAVHRCLHSVAHQIEDHAQRAGLPLRFCAVKLIEGDEALTATLALDENELELLEHSVAQMEKETGLDRHAALADMRYAFIEGVTAQTVHRGGPSKQRERSAVIDRVLTGKYTALPVFFAVMLSIFYLTFNVIGSFLSDALAAGIDALAALTDGALTAWGVNSVVHSLVIDGIFAGVGGVLSFLPIIVTLFFFLSILEDTGYMARVAFVMDKPLRAIGLSGKSVVPMLIGFGCSVPAVMATRTLQSDRDRRMTILLTPFMSCSAKIPIYAVFAAAFFPRYAALVMIGLYVLGIVVGILAALLMKGTAFRGKSVPFVMELPNYRMPSPRTVALLLWEKARDFLQRAFTIIFMATVVIWFLQTFDARLNVASSSEASLLALLGRGIAPLFAPLGFGDWRAATALVTGFTAKEAVVSTLGVLMGVGAEELGAALPAVFTPLSAFTFLTFTLLYTPCAAAIAAVKRELGSATLTIGVVAGQCAVAWGVAWCVFQIGGLLL
jgi:ferrous iron transport protein B